MLWSRLCLPLLLLAWAQIGAAQGASRFVEAARDPAVITRALTVEQVVSDGPITGVTVPHHILAADLIARGLRAASAQKVDQIILIGPDHFRSLGTPFGVLTAPLDTAMGTIKTGPLADKLAREPDLFSDVGSAPREHAIHAVTPFIAALFPDVPVTAIITATASRPADWEAAIGLIAPHLTDRVLIVQSTDYSHFLPRDIAVQRDMETLGVIVANDPQAVLDLGQPAHTDSKASQYLQMRLQELMGGQPMVVAHRDAYDYVPGEGAGTGPTTSYIVTLYGPDPGALSALEWPDQTRIVFGGDVFLGRGWTQLLEAHRLGPVIADLNARRGRDAFIVNLEGVILPEQPAGANSVQHLMLGPSALPALGAMGVTGANTANNHGHDFGLAGLEMTGELLSGAGITPLQNGVVSDVAGLALLPLSFKRSYFYDHPVIRSLDQLDMVCAAETDLPIVVLAHWGADYSATAGPDEMAALDRLARCGVTAVIGAHTHQASSAVTVHGGGRLQAVFSMGNLLFDQTGEVSGALVELRRFSKGTVALRLIPVPNYFQMARGQE